MLFKSKKVTNWRTKIIIQNGGKGEEKSEDYVNKIKLHLS